MLVEYCQFTPPDQGSHYFVKKTGVFEQFFQSNFIISQVLSVIVLQPKDIKYETFIIDVHHSFLCNTN